MATDKKWRLILRRSMTTYSVLSGPIWPKLELILAYMYVNVFVAVKYQNGQIENNRKKWRYHFPQYKAMETFKTLNGS